MKKRVLAAILILVMMFGITCCGIRQDTGQVKITMYLWDKSMTRAFTPWLEAQFPDIDFTFVIELIDLPEDFFHDINIDRVPRLGVQLPVGHRDICPILRFRYYRRLCFLECGIVPCAVTFLA